MWVALAALTILVIRIAGWKSVKRYSGTLLVLVLSLAALPVAGLLKVAMPYRKRIVARLKSSQSVPVLLPSGCSVFPANNIWNTRVADLPVDAKSTAYVQSMGADLPLHPDFGPSAGIPYGIVSRNLPPAQVALLDFAGESDRGPYRIADDNPTEAGSDSHVVSVDPDACRVYELFSARRAGPNQWEAASAASFDLRSNRLRPAGWTSADAAGLPIFAGLARYEEIQAGRIAHALRFTTPATRQTYVWPARHAASRSNDPNRPPMGQRFRLRKGVDLSGFSAEARIILTALQEYGMILADNGSPWFLTGSPDSRWGSGLTAEFRRIKGGDFEAVDTSSLMLDRDSGEARQR
jgi:hypothetical protein